VRRLERAVWNVVVNGIGASVFFPRRLRPVVLRLLGAQVGRRVHVSRSVTILSNRLVLGDRVYLNTGTVLDNKAQLVIGDDVALAPGALITTAGHDLTDPRRRQGAVTALPTTVGRGTWIGARAVVLPGVTIGEGCVIAAGAVVNRDCTPHTLCAGVPARAVRDLPASEHPPTGHTGG
jgi:maltose O-acetyltransferase